ncbi:MAG: hypothetical protein ACE5K3_00995 [bacterium]
MKVKRLLAAFLLGVGLCFVPILGHGEVKEWMYEQKATQMAASLSWARINYIMGNPTNFLFVGFFYDPDGELGIKSFPEGVDTRGKIIVWVQDNRGVFSYKSGTALLDLFKGVLENIYSAGLQSVATDMKTDIVAKFHTKREIPLGYFYQGKYHLWEK